MTPEERTKRNADLCAYYKEGNRVSKCMVKFDLGEQRVMQILKDGGVWTPPSRGERTKFLGVHISEDTKDALQEKAKELGISVSKLTSDVLDEIVK